ncbi:serine hydrolase domain-containing protein [Micromonospora lutea]|uniref:Serine hydrolase n=1 Tax=Micromonospora lutea TaxID=419825 RepID=A0ABQ4J094_9ACTN|nr:serine hydrolase domain-containing protein [Micromonospora lutea]GIJ23596.1 serine hydrolase [Micromonospora lutea]
MRAGSQRRTFTAAGNRMTGAVDAGLTGLARRLASRPGLHHVSLALSSTDGQRHWSGGSGPEGADEPEVRPETPFFIASITKRFIITLVLQAHERGELDLDAPITTYLPASVTTGLHVRRGVDQTPQITVRHLASHTSGLPDFFERRRGAPSLYRQLRAGHDTSWTFDDVIGITREQQGPHFSPQDLAAATQRARYSDTGFQLLIRILESVTSCGFPDLLAERLTGPLGLNRTWHPAAEPAEPGLPAPLPLYAGRRRVDVGGVIASSNDLYSTTSDLLTFERALLAGEPFGDRNTRYLLTERRNRLRNAPVLRYGLGTMIFTVNRLMSPLRGPVTLVGHSGSTGTWLFTCPELDLHLAGTVDQTEARGLPFRIMAACLRIWAG